MAKTTESGPLSKYDAVCATLRDGVTRPTDGVVHAKERHGVEMTPNQFSAHKSRAVLEGVIPAEATAKQAEAPESKAVHQDAAKPTAPKPVAPKAVAKTPPAPRAEAEAAPALKPTTPAAVSSPADLARQVKQLVEKYGAGAVRDMTGVFEG